MVTPAPAAAVPDAPVSDAPVSDAIVFFGATGDLAYKQIFPALQGLVRDEGIDVPIIGIAKAGWTLDQLRARARASLVAHGGFNDAAFARLVRCLRYVDGDYNDPATFDRLHAELGGSQRPLHYLAIPPSLFGVVAEGLARGGLAQGARLVVEKPFGRDRASAAALDRTLQRHFPEDAIFRIDHYLGKEPVQNIVYARFANAMFQPLWNRDHISSIQITMAEAFGVQDRGRFYDETGALRDVVQNHMLQVLAHLMMDAPTGEDHEAVRDKKADLLKAIRPLDASRIVRGQYRGYREVPGVRPESPVETFVAIRLFVESWR
jgi:glucose-6-phosphate 1-dehydrogenase